MDEPELILAAQENNIERVRELLNPDVTEDVNIMDSNGFTALSHAAQEGYEEIVRMLLDYQRGTPRAVNVNHLDESGTPLHRAVGQGYNNIVRMLLQEPNINVNVRDRRDGNTPLHLLADDLGSIYSEETATAELLLSRNDLNVNKKNFDGSTPLLIAIQNNNIHLANLILKHPGYKGEKMQIKNLLYAKSKEMLDFLLSQPNFNVNYPLPKPERILRRDKTYEYESFYPPTLPRKSDILGMSFHNFLNPSESRELRKRAIRQGAIYSFKDVFHLYKEDIQKLNAIALRMQVIDKIIPNTMTSFDSEMPSRLQIEAEMEYDEESRSYKRAKMEDTLKENIQKLKAERDALSITSQVLIQDLFRNLRIPPPDIPNNGFYVKEILRYLREKYYETDKLI